MTKARGLTEMIARSTSTSRDFMKDQRLLFNLVDLAQDPPELVEILGLLKQATEAQAVELKDPALTVADCLAMKRAAEKFLALARAYSLEAERQLGQILLEMNPVRG